MGSYLYWTDKKGSTQILWFDVVTEEAHHLQTEATEHPVEEGADVTDHVRPKVDRVTLSTFVSNTPIIEKTEIAAYIKQTGKLLGVQSGAVEGVELDVKLYEPPLTPTPGSVLNALSSAVANLLGGKKQFKAQVLKFAKEFDNVQEVYDALQSIRKNGILVNVVTSTRTYRDMCLEDISMNRTAETGTGATFHVECKEIRIVSTLKVKAPKPAEAAGFPRKNLGAKGPDPADDPTKRESVLFKGIGKLGEKTGVNIF